MFARLLMLALAASLPSSCLLRTFTFVLSPTLLLRFPVGMQTHFYVVMAGIEYALNSSNLWEVAFLAVMHIDHEGANMLYCHGWNAIILLPSSLSQVSCMQDHSIVQA